MSNKRIRLVTVAITAGLLVAACGSDDDPADTTTPSSDTGSGIANPASEFCVEQGGTVEIVTETAGEVGYCNLPDGTRVEEWAYFRAEHPDATDVGATAP